MSASSAANIVFPEDSATEQEANKTVAGMTLKERHNLNIQQIFPVRRSYYDLRSKKRVKDSVAVKGPTEPKRIRTEEESAETSMQYTGRKKNQECQQNHQGNLSRALDTIDVIYNSALALNGMVIAAQHIGGMRQGDNEQEAIKTAAGTTLKEGPNLNTQQGIYHHRASYDLRSNKRAKDSVALKGPAEPKRIRTEEESAETFDAQYWKCQIEECQQKLLQTSAENLNLRIMMRTLQGILARVLGAIDGVYNAARTLNGIITEIQAIGHKR